MKVSAIFSTFAAALITLTLSATAQAVVQAPGTFVPSQCGLHQMVTADAFAAEVRQVCIGVIAGEETRGSTSAVTFAMGDGTSRLFRVSQTGSFLMKMSSGYTNTNLYLVGANGQTATMKVIQSRDGEILSAAGQLETVNYHVPEFETVFTIQ
jgi:hypothetical protein